MPYIIIEDRMYAWTAKSIIYCDMLLLLLALYLSAGTVDARSAHRQGYFQDKMGSLARLNETLNGSNNTSLASFQFSSSMVGGSRALLPSASSQPTSIPLCYQRRRGSGFTQYWVPKEAEWDEQEDDARVYLHTQPQVPLKDESGKVIKMVSRVTFDKCRMEGTCLLDTGTLVNLGSRLDTFEVLGDPGRSHNLFGLGAYHELVPFVSIASNDLAPGQVVYIPELDGYDLGHMKHNGCVRVDDTGWSFNNCQIDFFVLSYVDYLWLQFDFEHVSPQFKPCQILNYVTKDHLAFVKADVNAPLSNLNVQRFSMFSSQSSFSSSSSSNFSSSATWSSSLGTSPSTNRNASPTPSPSLSLATLSLSSQLHHQA